MEIQITLEGRMKLGSLLSVFCLVAIPAVGFSATAPLSACQLKEQQRMRMNVIASNIVNINSTRTPQGGVYQRQKLECSGATCTVSEVRGELLKYEPQHPDANEEGYVAYPKINLMEEMTDMIVAAREYEWLVPGCPDKSDDKFKKDLAAELLPNTRK
jgi:flagellar basal-body rod protein FlgC